MTLKVLFFAAARDLAGASETAVTTVEAVTLGELSRRLGETHPALKKLLPSCRYAVNAEYAPMDQPLNDGDEIAVIPPVSGGEDTTVYAAIVRRPIDISALSARVTSPANGAALTFAGTVREDMDGRRKVIRIEYEGYEPMAEKVLNRIARDTAEKHGARVAVEHRLGVLAVSEISVGIAVGSPHRSEGFSALRDVIETIKKELPIWKRENFSDGSSEWVNCAVDAKQ